MDKRLPSPHDHAELMSGRLGSSGCMPGDVGTSSRLSVLVMGLVILMLMGCQAPKDAGRQGLMSGSFLSDIEAQRVADLMARDMVREPLFYEPPAPRVALVKIENNTNQYFFEAARNAYLLRVRTQLDRALGPRVKFVSPEIEEALRAELERWYLDDEDTMGVVRGLGAKRGVDYLLTGSFSSIDKVVRVPDGKGDLTNQKTVDLLMVFSLVHAETGEIAWQNSVASAAAFTTRDFQD